MEAGELRDVIYPIRLADFPTVRASMDYLDQVRRLHAQRTAEESNLLPIERRRDLRELRSQRSALGTVQCELVERWFPAGVSVDAHAVMHH
jgi:hypothetical protein